MKCIINGKIILPKHVVEGKALLFDRKIEAIIDANEVKNYEGLEIIDAKGQYVAPGLVEVHMHGCGGEDTSDNKPGAIQKMSQMIAGFGVTSWLPTSMTLPAEHLAQTFELVREAKAESAADPENWGGAEVLGVNMEGPYINADRKGAHVAEYIQAPDVEFVKQFADVIKLVTIAADVPGGMEFVERISEETDIICSLGHTAADYATAKLCFSKGCNHVTHLFNAQTGLLHRDPGVVGAALTSPEVYTEMICDTFHIHPGVFQLVADCKKDKLVLITDCMRAGGLPDGEYELGGQAVYVKGIECRLENGTIAGSVLRLHKAVQNIVKHTTWGLAEAVAAASLSPAKSIGVEDRKGSLEVGKDADILIADADFEIINTYVGGYKVYGN